MTSTAIIQTRPELKDHFKNGSIPTGQDFADLIDSVLVKRDDQFFGLWQNGAGYKEGDVVLYTNKPAPDNDAQVISGLYVFTSKKQAEANARAQGKDCDCLDDDCCGNKPPGECCRWQLIRVDTSDWHVVKDDSQAIMYAEAVGKLGVGTKTPGAFFHLNDETEGLGSQFLFNPAGSNGGPRLQLKSGIQSQGEENDNALYVDQTIQLNGADTSVEWLTNVPLGYMFKKQPVANAEGGQPQETLLLLVGSDTNHAPRVGINTNTPQATLDVVNGTSSIQLQVDDPNVPQLILLKAEGKNKVTQVTQTIDNQQANWTTNALHGFLFSTAAQKPIAIFDATGNVGIGTTTPAAKLEIADEKGTNGRFSFDVESVNPVLTVTNLKDDGDEVKLNLYVDDTMTVLDTNAQQGFEFRQNDARILSLSRDTNAKKPTFSALIDGFAHTNGLYVRSLQGDSTPIETALEFLKTLEPKQRSAEGDNHIQMGFVFTGRSGRNPKLAKKFPDNTFGIAQHNLIALLVRSVQELDEKVTALQEEIKELKKGK